MAKTKIAFFDLTGCEGCQFQLLSLNELLLDLFQDFEITNWRLLAENSKKDFDIAFIEGAVTTEKQIALLKEIRQTARFVVAIGACAINGNFFGGLTNEQRQKMAKKIYDKDYQLKAEFLQPIEKYIAIDGKIEGCPPNINKFKSLLLDFKSENVDSKVKSINPPDYIAKIEGHGSLKINFQYQTAEFIVEESERLIEGLLLEKNFEQAPIINSRICGICPVAHNLCSWKTIEAALDLEPSQETVSLREIMLCAQMVKSHLMHLFFLVLPDYGEVKSSIDLSLKYPAEFHLMLNLKRVCESALEIITGSTSFPVYTGLGGFTKLPRKNDLLSIRDAINEAVDEAQDLIRLFAGLEIPTVKIKSNFLTTEPEDGKYPLYRNTKKINLTETLKANSTSKYGWLNQAPVKVGALARISRFADRLNPMAKKSYRKYPISTDNPFHNNLAQAIEILHYLEEMRFLIESLIEANLDLAKTITDLKPLFNNVWDDASLEAPRGVLIHQINLDKNGKIIDYNIIPPTQINLASLEKEAQELIKTKGLKKTEAETLIEKLIRAFDPCITCAVH